METRQHRTFVLNWGRFRWLPTEHGEFMMAEIKTKPNDQNVEQFLNAIEDERKRKDSFTILKLMQDATGLQPRMWGSSIVGFGSYHYKYASGREGDSALAGFSPRKQNLTIYIMGRFDSNDDLLKKLGKHSLGKGCLYIKRLDDIDLPTLKRLIEESVKNVKQRAELK
jgi:Domain of unknown function (DU1801)